MSLFRNTASVLLTTAGSVGLGFIGSVVSARWLSLEERGQLALAAAITMTVVMVAQLGLPAGVIYRLRRIGAPPARVSAAALLAGVALSLVAVGVVVMFRAPVADRFLAGAPIIILTLSLASVPFVLVGNVFSGIARGIDRFDLQNAYRFTRSLLVAAVAIGVLVVAGRGLLEFLQVQLLVTAVLAVVLVVAVARQTGFRFRVELAEAREIARVGAKSWVSTVAGALHERIDLFMLAVLLADAEEVAIYAIAVSVSSLVKLAPESMASAMLPHVAGQEMDEASAVSAVLLRHSMMWMGLTMIASIVVAPFVIPWVYGPAYAASVPVFDLLLIGVLFLTIYRLLSRYFFAIDRQGLNAALQLGSLALNVALNVVLIPRHGALGAAAASLFSYGAEGIVCALWFRRESGIGLREMFVFRWEDLDPYTRRVRARLRR